MERAFPEANPKFRAKLDKMSQNYKISEDILDNYFGTKNILGTASKAEHQALAKIFDVSEDGKENFILWLVFQNFCRLRLQIDYLSIC